MQLVAPHLQGPAGAIGASCDRPRHAERQHQAPAPPLRKPQLLTASQQPLCASWPSRKRQPPARSPPPAAPAAQRQRRRRRGLPPTGGDGGGGAPCLWQPQARAAGSRTLRRGTGRRATAGCRTRWSSSCSLRLARSGCGGRGEGSVHLARAVSARSLCCRLCSLLSLSHPAHVGFPRVDECAGAWERCVACCNATNSAKVAPNPVLPAGGRVCGGGGGGAQGQGGGGQGGAGPAGRPAEPEGRGSLQLRAGRWATGVRLWCCRVVVVWVGAGTLRAEVAFNSALAGGCWHVGVFATRSFAPLVSRWQSKRGGTSTLRWQAVAGSAGRLLAGTRACWAAGAGLCCCGAPLPRRAAPAACRAA